MTDRLFPTRQQQRPVTRMDLIGHSLAAETGSTSTDYGAWHKIASHLQPAFLKSSAQASAKVAGIEGATMYGVLPTYSGYARVLQEWRHQDRGPLAPYLPNSQLVCIWYGINDLAWVGSQNMAAIQEGLRTVLSRMKAAVVFEDSDTTVRTGITPVTYTGSWTTAGGGNSSGFTSGFTYRSSAVAYPTNKVTLQIPPDYGVGVLQVGFLSGLGSNNGGIWDIVDVTAGGATTLASAYDARNRGPFNHGSTRAADGRPIICMKRVALTAAPTTTLTADLKVGDTTATVTSTTGWDTAGAVQVGHLRYTYTGKGATSLTGLALVSGTAVRMVSGTTVTGSRSVELRPTTVSTAAYFDHWALEATTTPLTMLTQQYRPMTFGSYAFYPYSTTRSRLNGNTSIGATSVTLASTTLNGAAGATGNVAVNDDTIVAPNEGAVLVDSEVMVLGPTVVAGSLNVTGGRGANGTTAATHLTGAAVVPWVRAGDTITIGTGAGAETTTVSSVAGAVITVPALAKAHSTGDKVVTGIQDYDVRSVLNPAIASLVTEFNDTSIFAIDPEVGLFGSADGTKDAAAFNPDGLHLSDEGGSRLAAYMLGIFSARSSNWTQMAKPAVPDPVAYVDSAYVQVAFQNSWSSVSTSPTSLSTGPAPFGYRKDFITKRVRLRGAVKNTSVTNSALTITTLPAGYRPAYDEDWVVPTDVGPQVLRVQADGQVLFPAGLAAVTGAYLNVMFEAGG